MRIFDILSQEGPQTASTLAALLNESSGATSYHLRALARHDLIREVPGKRGGRERWWERPRGGIVYDSRAVEGSPAGQAALQVAVAEVHRRRNAELVEYFTGRIEHESAEWADASSSMTANLRLTAEQTRQLSTRIEAIIDEAANTYRDQEGPDVRRVSVRADLFPLASRTTTQEAGS